MAQGHGDAQHHHIIPLKTYVNVLATLLILTVITVAASHFDFGPMNTVINIGIASVKASLVLAIFMHLKYEKPSLFWSLVPAVLFVLLMMNQIWPDAYRLARLKLPIQ